MGAGAGASASDGLDGGLLGVLPFALTFGFIEHVRELCPFLPHSPHTLFCFVFSVIFVILSLEGAGFVGHPLFLFFQT